MPTARSRPPKNKRPAARIPLNGYSNTRGALVYLPYHPSLQSRAIFVSLDLEVSLVDRVIVGLPNSTFEALPAPRRLVETCVASVREAEQSGDAAKIIDWLDRNQLQPGADALLLGCLREVLHARSVDRDPLTDAVNSIHREIAQLAREHCRLQTMHRQMGEHASATATILVAGLRTFDADLADDSGTVGYLAQRFATFLELGDHVCGRTGLCGLLHDIGKIAVPRSILRKTEPLIQRNGKFYKPIRRPVRTHFYAFASSRMLQRSSAYTANVSMGAATRAEHIRCRSRVRLSGCSMRGTR